jgi:PAS domain S-box-containing protein
MKKDEVVGRYVLDVTPNSQLPEILRTGRTDKADVFIINSRATIVTRMPIIKKGIIIGAIGKSLFLDMSGAQVFMKKMQESEKEFQAISEALIESPYMVYVIVDKDGFITAMNQTYLDILGLKKEDVVGKYILDITPTSGLQEVLDTGKIVQAEIWPIKDRDTVVTRLPVYKDGKIIGAIGKSLFLDMSGAKIFARKLQETEKELNLYKEEVRLSYQAKWELQDLIGVDKEFSATKTLAYQLSRTTSTILITGESGTGKELFAHAIHNASNRYLAPFVRINCAALPENLLESELFGYEEGAFTGAKKGGKPGKFELAHSGTIFLDEIGDMPLTMQTKLLTVLQDKMVERVGGTRPIMISVRVIAATNRDLEKMVMEGQFRQDLYYRLNVVRLNIPPLRSRRSDIPVLVSELMNRINDELQTNVTKISCKAIELLQNYAWPGNVRELENMLERAINLADMNHESSLTINHFPSLVEKTQLSEEETLTQAVESLEKRSIIKALKKVNGNKTQAAKLLGIHSSALYRKLDKYDLE